jgi:hypothetical protein
MLLRRTRWVFSRKWKEYTNGTLKNVDKKKIRNRKFEAIEKVVAEYIEL